MTPQLPGDVVTTNPHVTEDVERQPDGFPHRVIGFTVLVSVMLAIVVLAVIATSNRFGPALAAVIALIAIPVVILTLRAFAARNRDVSHPSR